MPPKTPERRDFADASQNRAAETKIRPFPAGMYRALIFVLIAGAAGGYDQLKNRVNPDSRTAEEMARAYLTYRPIVTQGKPGKPTANEAKTLGKNALGVLNGMCHPLGDSYDGKDKKQCKRESDTSFMDNHDPSKPQKYVLRTSGNYTNEKSAALLAESINRTRQDQKTKDSVKWYTDMYDEWKKGRSDTEAELSTQFADIFLGQGAECWQGYDGNCIKAYDGTDCLFLADLARQLNRQTQKMKADGKQEPKPSVCARTNLHQATGYSDISNQGHVVTDSRPGGRAVAMPGNSAHERLIGMDLPNYAEAEPYLAEIGMGCDKVDGDPGHCSFGEGATQGKLKKFGKSVKNTVKKGVKVVKDIWHRRGHKK